MFFKLKFIGQNADHQKSKVWKGSVKVGPAGSEIEVPAFNTATLSADATQAGASLTGTEGTELVLVNQRFTGSGCILTVL